jgi:hypothetical protein
MLIKFRQRLLVEGTNYEAGEMAELSSSLARTIIVRGSAEVVDEKRLRQAEQNRIRRPKQNRRK